MLMYALFLLLCVVIFLFYHFKKSSADSIKNDKTIYDPIENDEIVLPDSADSPENKDHPDKDPLMNKNMLRSFSNAPENKDSNIQINTDHFKSCDCPELATWHPGQISHKYNCPKFYSLNPGRTKQEFIKTNEWLDIRMSNQRY